MWGPGLRSAGAVRLTPHARQGAVPGSGLLGEAATAITGPHRLFAIVLSRSRQSTPPPSLFSGPAVRVIFALA